MYNGHTELRAAASPCAAILVQDFYFWVFFVVFFKFCFDENFVFMCRYTRHDNGVEIIDNCFVLTDNLPENSRQDSGVLCSSLGAARHQQGGCCLQLCALSGFICGLFFFFSFSLL